MEVCPCSSTSSWCLYPGN